MRKTKDEKSEPTRGRPGRRSAAERYEAMKALLSGKASIEQLSQKYAVSQETMSRGERRGSTRSRRPFVRGAGVRRARRSSSVSSRR